MPKGTYPCLLARDARRLENILGLPPEWFDTAHSLKDWEAFPKLTASRPSSRHRTALEGYYIITVSRASLVNSELKLGYSDDAIVCQKSLLPEYLATNGVLLFAIFCPCASMASYVTTGDWLLFDRASVALDGIVDTDIYLVR